MNSNIQFVDEPPAAGGGRPKKYNAEYEACKANPGKWCIWSNDSATSAVATMKRQYPGVRFTMRNVRNQRGTMWGSYVGSGAE